MTITKLGPESYDIANLYIQLGTSKAVSETTGIPEHVVVETLSRPDTKAYLNGVYLDLGYRNRNKLGALLDKMIDSKVEEAEESGIYTSKDLVDLLTLAHKMRMDEIKAEKADTTVNVNNFGDNSNYGQLMNRLLEGRK
jgi:hypothetical protein